MYDFYRQAVALAARTMAKSTASKTRCFKGQYRAAYHYSFDSSTSTLFSFFSLSLQGGFETRPYGRPADPEHLVGAGFKPARKGVALRHPHYVVNDIIFCYKNSPPLEGWSRGRVGQITCPPVPRDNTKQTCKPSSVPLAGR